MNSTVEIHGRATDHRSLGLRGLLGYFLVSLVLVVSLIAYCELCSVIMGLPAPGLLITAPWALQVSLPWMVVGAVFGTFGRRVAESRSASTHPRILIATVIVGVGVFALLFETLLAVLRGLETPLALFVYQRSMIHLAASALLVSSYLANRFWQLHHLRTPRIVEPRSGDVLATPGTAANSPTAGNEMEVLTGTGRTSICVDDIECLQADRNYINVVLVSGKTYLLRQTMAATERSLDEACFVRIHRSMIVNRHMIKERRPGGVLVLQSGRMVNVSRAYRDRLRPES
jgi:hypothetical protein